MTNKIKIVNLHQRLAEFFLGSMLLLFIALIVFLAFPYTVYNNVTTPIEVVNEDKEVVGGEVLYLRFDRCKKIETPSTATYTVYNGVVYVMPFSLTYDEPAGCIDFVGGKPFPEDIPPGRYKIRITLTSKLWIKEIVEHYETEEFTVTGEQT